MYLIFLLVLVLPIGAIWLEVTDSRKAAKSPRKGLIITAVSSMLLYGGSFLVHAIGIHLHGRPLENLTGLTWFTALSLLMGVIGFVQAILVSIGIVFFNR